MRLLKFIGAFVVTTVIIFGLVLGLNWKAFKTFLDNRESMMEGTELVANTSSLATLVDFIDEHPEYVSVASKVVTVPDSIFLYQPETPRVMGSVANIFILVAGAIELESGAISGRDRIPWEEIRRYQLPDVHETDYTQSYHAANERGWIENGTITVSDALKLLAEFNNLALADYFWWRIDSSTWEKIRRELELEQTELPLPYSGLYQAISPGLQQKTVEEIQNQWQNASSTDWRKYVASLSTSYLHSEEREFIREYLAKHRLGATFMEERDAMILFPKTTAREMVRILEILWNDELISSGVSTRVKEWMRWPLVTQRGIRNDFADYGAMYDSRMGLLNGLDFGTSAYTGESTVQVVFFDRLPIAFWFHMSSNHMHQDFQQRLIVDPALIERFGKVVR